MPPLSFAARERRRKAHIKAQEKAKRVYADHLRKQQQQHSQPHHGSNALGPRGGKRTRKSKKNNKKNKKTRKNKRKSSRRHH